MAIEIKPIKKEKNTAHFYIKVKEKKKLNKNEIIQGIIICSDTTIRVWKDGGRAWKDRENIFVYITSKDFSDNPKKDLRKEPHIVAVNANSNLEITKTTLNRRQMKITVSFYK